MEEMVKHSTAQQIAENSCYPFTMGQIRHFLLNRHKNGLKQAVRRIGKRLYIRQDLFELWIEEQKEGKWLIFSLIIKVFGINKSQT